MITKICFFLLFITSFFSYSQKFEPIDTADYKIRKELFSKYKKKHTNFYKEIKKEYKGNVEKELLATYKSTHKEFLKNITKKRLVLDTRFTNYTDSITELLLQVNPNLKDKNLTILISKNPVINAFNIGEGIIVLHLGLFSFLENDAQLISVLSHEIGHETLQHVSKKIKYNVELATSSEKKLLAKRIRRGKYNQFDKSFSILKNLLYSDSKKHRKSEMEADSIGYLYYSNTNLRKQNYVKSLELLDTYDSLPSLELDSLVYRKFFNLPKQPFKNEWLKMESFSEYNYSKFKEKINKDSIKSHPEFVQRINKLKKDFPELNKENSDSFFISNQFKKLQKIARKEEVANLYYLEKYGRSTQLTLLRLNKNPDDAYLKKWLGLNFLKLYEAKKKYQLNRYLDRIVPKKQSIKYQQFLSFIWNLKLNELKNIGDYYSEKTIN
jgi:Zn-dependent protease with chaperone function